ncbi:MAG: hypothetical protein ACTSRP_03320 [Candidatus Helarchaeota archaeon]
MSAIPKYIPNITNGIIHINDKMIKFTHLFAGIFAQIHVSFRIIEFILPMTINHTNTQNPMTMLMIPIIQMMTHEIPPHMMTNWFHLSNINLSIIFASLNLWKTNSITINTKKKPAKYGNNKNIMIPIKTGSLA